MTNWHYLLLHLTLGYPIYQLLGTIKHELAHAVAFKLSGFGIQEFRILPFRNNDGTFFWGCVTPEIKDGARDNVHIYYAPYYVDFVLIVTGLLFGFCLRSHIDLATFTTLEVNGLITAVMLTIVSPIVDILYNLYKYWRWNRGDFAQAHAFSLTH